MARDGNNASLRMAIDIVLAAMARQLPTFAFEPGHDLRFSVV
jgi:hypothetical protein